MYYKGVAVVKKKRIVIWDQDSLFVVGFSNFVNRNGQSEYLAMGFESQQQCQTYIEQQGFDLLFVSEDGKEEFAAYKTAMWLTKKETKQMPYIYKYQSVEALIQSAQEYEEALRLQKNLKEQMVYCVISPVGRCGKTAFAKEIAAMTTGFYIPACGYETELENLKEVEVLLYELQQNDSITEAMQEVVKGKQQLPRSYSPLDYRELCLKQWELLIKLIKQETQCRYVVIDLGLEAVRDYTVLQCADQIYVPTLENTRSQGQAKAFADCVKQQVDCDIMQVLCPKEGMKEFVKELLGGGYGQVPKMEGTD